MAPTDRAEPGRGGSDGALIANIGPPRRRGPPPDGATPLFSTDADPADPQPAPNGTIGAPAKPIERPR